MCVCCLVIWFLIECSIYLTSGGPGGVVVGHGCHHPQHNRLWLSISAFGVVRVTSANYFLVLAAE